MELNGEDLRPFPLVARKRKLQLTLRRHERTLMLTRCPCECLRAVPLPPGNVAAIKARPHGWRDSTPRYLASAADACRSHTGSRVAIAGRLLSPFERSRSCATSPQIAGIYKQQKLREGLPSGTPLNWQLRSQRSPAQRDRRGTSQVALGHRRNRRHSCNADGMPCTAGMQDGTA